MNRIAAALVLLLVCVTPLAARPPVAVEILYMNHGPLRPTVQALAALLKERGEKVAVTWYEAESDEGVRFAKERNVRGHVPLMAWIDGQTTLTLGQREVTFAGFPAGAGPAFARGAWTMDDFSQALDAVLAH